MVTELMRFSLFQDLSAEHVDVLASMIRPVTFNDGDLIIEQDDDEPNMVFILEGRIKVTRDGEDYVELGSGDVTGLVRLVMGVPSLGSSTAHGTVTGLAVAPGDFQHLREIAPELDRACRELTAEQLGIIREKALERRASAAQWFHQATRAITTGSSLPSVAELQRAKETHSGAPLAIWLGILLDGIPESFVIGAGLLIMLNASTQPLDAVSFSAVIPYTLIAGLFLSNFPEALASSANMRLQGWGKARIFSLWFALMVITAVGAGVGFLLAENLSAANLVFAEGVAAGAMLTMIAAAMIPEAVHMGNANFVGLSTLAGFMSAICFKLLE